MAAQTQAQRRDRIKREIIDPLIEKGMRKPKTRTREDHDAWLDRLANDLAWLEPEWFESLIAIIEEIAEGKSRTVWPSRLAILGQAKRMSRWADTPPIVASYMRSIEGRRAWRRHPAHASKLCTYLTKTRRAPSANDLAHIANRGEELRQTIAQAEADLADPAHAGEARAYLAKWGERRIYLARLIWGRLNRGADDDGRDNRARTGEGYGQQKRVEHA